MEVDLEVPIDIKKTRQHQTEIIEAINSKMKDITLLIDENDQSIDINFSSINKQEVFAKIKTKLGLTNEQIKNLYLTLEHTHEINEQNHKKSKVKIWIWFNVDNEIKYQESKWLDCYFYYRKVNNNIDDFLQIGMALQKFRFLKIDSKVVDQLIKDLSTRENDEIVETGTKEIVLKAINIAILNKIAFLRLKLFQDISPFYIKINSSISWWWKEKEITDNTTIFLFIKENLTNAENLISKLLKKQKFITQVEKDDKPFMIKTLKIILNKIENNDEPDDQFSIKKVKNIIYNNEINKTKFDNNYSEVIEVMHSLPNDFKNNKKLQQIFELFKTMEKFYNQTSLQTELVKSIKNLFEKILDTTIENFKIDDSEKWLDKIISQYLNISNEDLKIFDVNEIFNFGCISDYRPNKILAIKNFLIKQNTIIKALTKKCEETTKIETIKNHAKIIKDNLNIKQQVMNIQVGKVHTAFVQELDEQITFKVIKINETNDSKVILYKDAKNIFKLHLVNKDIIIFNTKPEFNSNAKPLDDLVLIETFKRQLATKNSEVRELMNMETISSYVFEEYFLKSKANFLKKINNFNKKYQKLQTKRIYIYLDLFSKNSTNKSLIKTVKYEIIESLKLIKVEIDNETDNNPTLNFKPNEYFLSLDLSYEQFIIEKIKQNQEKNIKIKLKFNIKDEISGLTYSLETDPFIFEIVPSNKITLNLYTKIIKQVQKVKQFSEEYLTSFKDNINKFNELKTKFEEEIILKSEHIEELKQKLSNTKEKEIDLNKYENFQIILEKTKLLIRLLDEYYQQITSYFLLNYDNSIKRLQMFINKYNNVNSQLISRDFKRYNEYLDFNEDWENLNQYFKSNCKINISFFQKFQHLNLTSNYEKLKNHLNLLETTDITIKNITKRNILQILDNLNSSKNKVKELSIKNIEEIQELFNNIKSKYKNNKINPEKDDIENNLEQLLKSSSFKNDSENPTEYANNTSSIHENDTQERYPVIAINNKAIVLEINKEQSQSNVTFLNIPQNSVL